MAQVTERLSVAKGIAIFQMENSRNWFARFKVGKTFITRTTKTADTDEAMIVACQLKYIHQLQYEQKRLVPLNQIQLKQTRSYRKKDTHLLKPN